MFEDVVPVCLNMSFLELLYDYWSTNAHHYFRQIDDKSLKNYVKTFVANFQVLLSTRPL